MSLDSVCEFLVDFFCSLLIFFSSSFSFTSHVSIYIYLDYTIPIYYDIVYLYTQKESFNCIEFLLCSAPSYFQFYLAFVPKIRCYDYIPICARVDVQDFIIFFFFIVGFSLISSLVLRFYSIFFFV